MALMIGMIASLGVSSWLSLTLQGPRLLIEKRLVKVEDSRLEGFSTPSSQNGEYFKAFELTRETSRQFTKLQGSGEIHSPSAELLSQVLTFTQTIQDAWSEALSLNGIASVYGKLNDPNQAAEILSLALQAAQIIEEDQLKLSALSKIATTYAELNDWSRAAELFSRVLQITQTVSNDRVKTEALKEIAYAVVKLNN